MKKSFLLIIIILLSLHHVYSQGPSAPEARSFEPIDATDMVNLLTGDFTYVLPLLNVPSPEGGYPLALSYHGGIAMGQEASWVGLGWNINPGAINRSIAGLPDDWLITKKYKSIYDQGGTSTSYSGGVGANFNGISLGIYASYSENKSFGGENSYGFDLGVNAGIGVSNSMSIGGSIGLSGASAGISVGSGDASGWGGAGVGISVSKNFKTGETSYGIGLTGSVNTAQGVNSSGGVSGSIGVSFSSRRGAFLTSSIGASSIGAGSSLSGSYSFRNDAFTILVPFVNFSYSRSRYWLYETDYITVNGSLYAGKFDELLDEELFDWKASFDSYQALYSKNRALEISNTNYSNIAYDIYSVSGQGLSGTIKPGIFEEGVLYLDQETLEANEDGHSSRFTSYYYPSTYNINIGKFNHSIDASSSNRINFYFDSEKSSYLKTTSGLWNEPNGSSNYSNVFDFLTNDPHIESQVIINGVTQEGYNSSNNRLRTGSFIETFTNEEIKTALSSGNSIHFIEAKNFNRAAQVLYPNEGIGGFRITAVDGKTYHYSLPVYQREMFSRSTKIDQDPNTQFFEESQFTPYATHWLLTAITGPDYIDINNDFKVDEQDYGYWVEFDYGKWSDGFSWRNPPGEDFEKNRDTKMYSWGVKDIYYLDKIKTRTHTALFVKEERLDSKSTEISIRDGANQKVYESNIVGASGAGIWKGDDENWYFRGTYENLPIPYPPTNYIVYKRNKIYVKTNSHKTLRLKRIILLKNSDPLSNISKYNSSQISPISGGDIDIDEEFDLYYQSGQFLGTTNKPVYNRSWSGQYYGNVLDVLDIDQNGSGIMDQALSVIDFDFDYDLMSYSPNSSANLGKKLTLSSVVFKGKKGIGLIPPYTFKYEGYSVPYSNEFKDEWGYSNSVTAWNLNQIITPIGETLEIVHEEDSFKEESAITNFVFDKYFQMKFTGSDPGDKWVTFRNDPDNLPEQDINFQDYFEVGQFSRVNIQYVFDPNNNGDERVADVDKICEVKSVTSTNVKFKLPYQSIQGYERSQETCHLDNFVYFNWYSAQSQNNQSVVQRTANFVSEHHEDDCSEVNTGEHRCKIQFYSSKPIINKNGGGIRVKEIKLKDELNNQYKTVYDYNIPNTTTSSGVTSFEPSNLTKEVKYISELPAPTVMYEHVTVNNLDSQGNIFSKNEYKFDVLKPMQLTADGFKIDGFLELTKTQNSTTSNITVNNNNSAVKLTKFNLQNNLSALGRLVSKKSFNQENQLIAESSNLYKANSEISQGIIQESFKVYKKVNPYFSFPPNNKYFISSSSTSFYPSILKKTILKKGGNSFETDYKNQDFLTGDILETQTFASDGTEIKTTIIPAYTIPEFSGNSIGYGMGSKVDDITNKNMLSQTAANYTFINKNGWKPIGVGITTWNKEWWYRNLGGLETTPSSPEQKIWRKHQTYIWDGEIDQDGIYRGYNISNFDGFDWDVESQPAPWKKTSQIERYSHYSSPLEVSDINNNFASTKFGDYDSKVIATSNAMYTEMYYSGAEYFYSTGDGYFDGEVSGANQSEDRSHTGKYSVKISLGQKGFTVDMKGKNPPEHRAGAYVISVWANKESYQNARTIINGAVEPFNGEIIPAGNWVQMNHYFDIPNSTTNMKISLTSASGTVYFDDFRISPLASSVTSYVYNEFDELTFILGSNNLGNKYQYDQAGRLIRIFEETVDTPTISGGFKLAKEYRYNYKNGDGGGGGDCPHTIFFSEVEQNTTIDPSTAKLVFATPGNTVYYEMTTNRYGDLKAHGIYNIGSDEYSIQLQVGENTRTITGSTQIPPNGILEVSIHHRNRVTDTLAGDSILTLISVDPETVCIGNPKILADRNLNN